jgi:uncharacterized membrane protein YjfL (UPF0719 family)
MDLMAGIMWAEVVATIFYAFLGLILMIVSYVVIDMLTPFSLHEELSGKANVAVAIVMGSVMISLSILIANVINS